MGIEPQLFGPSLWGAIHYIALGAPETLDSNQKIQYKNFYMLLPQIIPCNNCGKHFQEILNNFPIDNYLNNAESLFTWTVIVHNEVNKRLEKPEFTVIDAKNKWMQNKNYNIDNLSTSKKTNSLHPMYELILKIIIVLLLFGGGIYIGKLLFTMEHKKK
jgi:hypothetical protein